jgi:hypothetical protein
LKGFPNNSSPPEKSLKYNKGFHFCSAGGIQTWKLFRNFHSLFEKSGKTFIGSLPLGMEATKTLVS